MKKQIKKVASVLVLGAALTSSFVPLTSAKAAGNEQAVTTMGGASRSIQGWKIGTDVNSALNDSYPTGKGIDGVYVQSLIPNNTLNFGVFDNTVAGFTGVTFTRQIFVEKGKRYRLSLNYQMGNLQPFKPALTVGYFGNNYDMTSQTYTSYPYGSVSDEFVGRNSGYMNIFIQADNNGNNFRNGLTTYDIRDIKVEQIASKN